MLRVPVIGGRQDWMQRQPLEAVREDQSAVAFSATDAID